MPTLPRPIHILGDTASSDIPCYIISPDDVISAIRENKTLFLKLLLRLDDTASWLSRQDLFLIKLHALAGNKMQASLRYEIRKKQIEVIKEYLRYLEGAGAKKDAVVNISLLKELLAPLTSKHHPLYSYVVTIEYLAYFNQFMSYLRAGDGLKYEEGTYAFGEEGFAPAVDAALKAKLREDLETLLTGFRRECELNFVESITVAQLETILKDLESLATAAEAEAKKSKRDYDTVMLEVEAGYAAVKERRDEIESLGRGFEQAMPSTFISHSGMNPSSVDFKKRLIKTFSRAVLDPLADLSYGSIKATPLHFAIHHLQDKLVDLFLAACIDRGENPLGEHQASGKKVIDRRGNTVLHLIAIILNESSTPGDESKLRALIKMFAAILDAAKQIKRGDVSKTSRKESFIQHETEVFILEAFLQKNNDEKTVLELLLANDKEEVFGLLKTYINRELISGTMEIMPSAFTVLSEAYAKLSDPASRQADEQARLNPKEAVAHDELSANPKSLNHYEYCNMLLKLEGDERIKPGDSLNWDELSKKLDSKIDDLERQLAIFEVGKQKLSPSERQQQALLERNHKHACELKHTWLDYSDIDFEAIHRLYDLSIGYCKTDEDREILQGVGGAKAIQKAMEQDTYMNFAPAVISLFKLGLLTPANFKKITAYCWYHQGRDCSKARCARYIAETLDLLKPANMADQAHLDFLVAHMSLPDDQIASSIQKGIRHLSKHKLITQKNLELVVEMGRRGELMGLLLSDLHVFGIWTPETEEMVTQQLVEDLPWENWSLVDYPDILQSRLLRMRDHKLLSPEKTKNLNWTPPKEFEELCSRINQMFAYGLYLLCCDDGVKGMLVLALALELKADLRQFIEKPKEEQARDRLQFQKDFIQKLHSHDTYEINKSEHDDDWKIVVSNILIALTGIGLFALGIHYLRTGHVFFAHTKREQLIEQVEESKWLKTH